MKRIITIFITIIIIYMFFHFIIHDLFIGHDLEYKIKEGKNTFEINEILNLKKDQGINNYYFKITKNKTKFEFKINDEFNKDMEIIEKINYYQDDEYECLLPIFKDDKTIVDMMCYYNDELYYAHNLPKQSKSLQKYLKDLKNYNQENWHDQNTKTKKQGPLTVNYGNILENHYLVTDNYRGVYLIDNENKIKTIELFDEDNYETNVKTIVDENYVIANYNQKYDFNEFYLIDVTNGKKDELIVNYDINFDSYVNGIYENSFFIFDNEEQLQYEINLKTKDANIVGDKNGIIVYNNDKKEIIKPTKEYKFNQNSDKNYDRIDEINGQYYFFKKVGNSYQVYKAPIENRKSKIYLFDTTDINQIYYVDNYIYFKNGNDVKYYHDNIGTRTLLNNTEYEFNNSLKYYVYAEV